MAAEQPLSQSEILQKLERVGSLESVVTEQRMRMEKLKTTYEMLKAEHIQLQNVRFTNSVELVCRLGRTVDVCRSQVENPGKIIPRSCQDSTRGPVFFVIFTRSCQYSQFSNFLYMLSKFFHQGKGHSERAFHDVKEEMKRMQQQCQELVTKSRTERDSKIQECEELRSQVLSKPPLSNFKNNILKMYIDVQMRNVLHEAIWMLSESWEKSLIKI